MGLPAHGSMSLWSPMSRCAAGRCRNPLGWGSVLVGAQRERAAGPAVSPRHNRTASRWFLVQASRTESLVAYLALAFRDHWCFVEGKYVFSKHK